MSKGLRVGYMSDLHLEFEERREFVGDAEWYALRDARFAALGHPEIGPWLGDLKGEIDILVVAGDTLPGVRGIDYMAEAGSYLGVPVATVAGNHEFYGHLRDDIRAELAERASERGVLFLDDSVAEVMVGERRVVLLGSTFWTDFALGEPLVPRGLAMAQATSLLNDFSDIYVGSRCITPADAAAWHAAARAFFEGAVLAADGADAVVGIFHHAPVRAAAPTGSRRGVACCYASAADEWLAALELDLAVFGHVHEELTLSAGRTPVVCACRGYVRRAVGWDFRPGRLEVPWRR